MFETVIERDDVDQGLWGKVIGASDAVVNETNPSFWKVSRSTRFGKFMTKISTGIHRSNIIAVSTEQLDVVPGDTVYRGTGARRIEKHGATVGYLYVIKSYPIVSSDQYDSFLDTSKPTYEVLVYSADDKEQGRFNYSTDPTSIEYQNLNDQLEGSETPINPYDHLAELFSI